MVFFRYMKLFVVLVLVGCGVSPSFEAASSHGHAPLVVYADADDWEPPVANTEANILTRRILQGSGADFRLDTPQSRELAREIERILSRIRDTHPVIKDVTARDSFDPWSLILHMEQDLYRKISRAVPPVSLFNGQRTLPASHRAGAVRYLEYEIWSCSHKAVPPLLYRRLPLQPANRTLPVDNSLFVHRRSRGRGAQCLVRRWS